MSKEYSIDQYPLLIFISFRDNQLRIQCSIDSTETDQTALCDRIFNAFNNVQYPNQGVSISQLQQSDVWCIPTSSLSQVNLPFDHIKELKHLTTKPLKIIQIEKVENTIWSMQYLRKKKCIKNRNNGVFIEMILYFQCSPSFAKDILKYGFCSTKDLTSGSFIDLQYIS